MNNLQLFQKDDFKIRLIDQNGEYWFIANDACEALGLDNVSQAVSKLDEDEKTYIILNDVSLGTPKKTIISESGLYSLILSSRKPEARKFRKWVTSEVLPAIRKTGSYHFNASPLAKWDKIEKALRLTVDVMRLADSGKLLMIRKACKECDISTSFLPDYSEEQITQSATALLKKYGSSLSAAVFNQNMERLGFLTLSSRTSSKGGLKHYWSITEKGLTYGKNLISEKNPRETQPHWYEDTFPQLIKLAQGAMV